MALAFVEVMPDQHRGIEGNPGTRLRFGFVATAFVDAARQAEGIPKQNDPHPTDSRLYCDDIAFDSNGAIVNVTIYYSSNGRFRGGAVVLKRQVGYYKWLNVIPHKEVIPIPLNVRNVRTVSQPGGLPDVDREVWVIQERPVAHRFKTWPLEVYAHVGSRNILNVHADMIDHIHTIGGRRLRFMGMVDARQEDGDQVSGNGYWTLRYQWDEDPGTPKPAVLLTSRTVFREPGNRQSHPFYLRVPYETFTVEPSFDPENVPHDTIALTLDVEAPSEWRLLPGVPNL